MWAGETSISPRVLHKCFLLYKQAREARVWVEVEGEGIAHGSRLQGPRGASTPSHPRLSQLISGVIQGMFLLSRLWAKILFDSGASHSFVAASSVDVLGLEVETLEEPFHVSSPLRTRVRIDQICQDCELEILGILLTVDL